MFQQKLLTKTFLATAMMGTIALTGCSKPAIEQQSYIGTNSNSI